MVQVEILFIELEGKKSKKGSSCNIRLEQVAKQLLGSTLLAATIPLLLVKYLSETSIFGSVSHVATRIFLRFQGTTVGSRRQAQPGELRETKIQKYQATRLCSPCRLSSKK